MLINLFLHPSVYNCSAPGQVPTRAGRTLRTVQCTAKGPYGGTWIATQAETEQSSWSVQCEWSPKVDKPGHAVSLAVCLLSLFSGFVGGISLGFCSRWVSPWGGSRRPSSAPTNHDPFVNARTLASGWPVSLCGPSFRFLDQGTPLRDLHGSADQLPSCSSLPPPAAPPVLSSIVPQRSRSLTHSAPVVVPSAKTCQHDRAQTSSSTSASLDSSSNHTW